MRKSRNSQMTTTTTSKASYDQSAPPTPVDPGSSNSLIKPAQFPPSRTPTTKPPISKQRNSWKSDLRTSIKPLSYANILLEIWRRRWERNMVRARVRECCGAMSGVRMCWERFRGGWGGEWAGDFINNFFLLVDQYFVFTIPYNKNAIHPI